MIANTSDENQARVEFDSRTPLWLFAYGSLIFKADFPYLEKRPASIEGWVRRFWQGSHDHRGTPDAPGRVVTLITEANAVCAGIAYRVKQEILDHLDFREKNGYLRFSTRITFSDGSCNDGLLYIATEDNSAFLGPATEAEIARHILHSSGPSGENAEYLIKLARALRQMCVIDNHVYRIEQQLLRMRDSLSRPSR